MKYGTTRTFLFLVLTLTPGAVSERALAQCPPGGCPSYSNRFWLPSQPPSVYRNLPPLSNSRNSPAPSSHAPPTVKKNHSHHLPPGNSPPPRRSSTTSPDAPTDINLPSPLPLTITARYSLRQSGSRHNLPPREGCRSITTKHRSGATRKTSASICRSTACPVGKPISCHGRHSKRCTTQSTTGRMRP